MATLGAHKKHKVTIVGSGNWYVAQPSVLPAASLQRVG